MSLRALRVMRPAREKKRRRRVLVVATGSPRPMRVVQRTRLWAMSCTDSIRIRLPSATGRLKPSWSGLRITAMVIFQRRSPAGDAAKETRHASTFGRTCTV